MIILQIDREELNSLIQTAVRNAIEENLNQTTQSEADQLLTIQQAAAILSLSVPTIYGLVSRAEVPCMKKGKRLYFSKQELTNWIKTGRKKTTSEIEVAAQKFITRKK